MASGTPALLCEIVLDRRHWPGAATPQPKKWEDGELWTARRDSCARTRNAVGNARRFALVPRGKQGGESVMQVRCKPVAWGRLGCCLRIPFVFASYSHRILLVFCAVSPVRALRSPRWLRCGCAFCLPALP